MADNVVSTYGLDIESMKASINEAIARLGALEGAGKKGGDGIKKSFDVALPSFNALSSQVKSLETLLKSATDPTKLQQFNKELIIAQSNLSKFSSGSALPKMARDFNQLQFAVTQFGRELPNAAIGGFTLLLTSWTNQTGQLIDGIAGIRRENELLAARGEKPISVFKALTSAIFSWQTLLQVGITLLVVYSKQVGEFVTALFKGAEATNKAAISLKSLNEAYDSKELKSGIKSIIDLRTNINLAKDGYLSKEKVLKQYNETLGVSFGNVNNLNDAEKGLVENTPAYIRAFAQRIAASKLAEQAAETLIKIEQLQVEQAKERALETIEFNERAAFGTAENNGKISAGQIRAIDNLKAIRNKARKEELDALNKQFNDQLNASIGFNQKAEQVLNDGLGAGGLDKIKDAKGAFDALNEEIGKLEKNIKDSIFLGKPVDEAVKKLESLKDKLKEVEGIYDRLQNPIDPNDISTIPSITPTTLTPTLTPEEVEKQQKDLLKKLEENAKGAKTSMFEYNKQINDYALANDKTYYEALDEFIKSGYKTFEEFEKAKTKLVTDEQKIRTEVISGGLQIAGTFASEYFNLERAQSKSDTDIKIAEQQKLLDAKLISEETFNSRSATIKNKQAQTDRDLALSQIKIQTALAIIKALASSSPPTNFILAGVAAVEGGIQYAFASAQPLPKYGAGTDRIRAGRTGIDEVPALLMKDEAVINARENMKHEGLAKAWNSGRLEPFLVDKYIQPAIDRVTREMTLAMNVDRSVKVNNNFTDKRIVGALDKNNRLTGKMLSRLSERESQKVRGRNWN